MTPTPPTEPSPPFPPPEGEAVYLGPVRSIETAPSQMITELPATARVIGFGGLFLFVLGVVAVVTNMALGPRWIGVGGGYMFASVGLALMLYHALRDGEQDVRRLYGTLAAAWLLLALAATVLPGPVLTKSASGVKEVGANLFPWGVTFGFLALLFAIPFARHETDSTYREVVVKGMLGVGGVLTAIAVVYSLFRPDFLAGWGIAVALLGLAFLAAYFAQVDTSEGLGYKVAFALGALGGAAAVYALARSFVPAVLYEGPGALRRVNQSLDPWKAVSRALAVVVFLGVAALAILRGMPGWLRGVLAAVGVGGAIVLVVGATTRVINQEPAAYFVPGGLALLGLGLLYLALSLGLCSDNVFVTLVRRELASFFLTPMGYVVLIGMVAVSGIEYSLFASSLVKITRPVREPIMGEYIGILALFAVVFLIPALTMRLFAEEKRTGSLEVLLTAPVSEPAVVLSKYLAAWLVFLIAWLPYAVFLVGLRIEGGQPFDYRPLLSFYLALAATGAGLIGMGLFFSSMTRSQLAAGVLTFAGMVAFLIVILADEFPIFGVTGKAVLSRLSFYRIWRQSLAGQLPVRDLFIHGSLGVLWAFLTVKVLEARKWS